MTFDQIVQLSNCGNSMHTLSKYMTNKTYLPSQLFNKKKTSYAQQKKMLAHSLKKVIRTVSKKKVPKAGTNKKVIKTVSKKKRLEEEYSFRKSTTVKDIFKRLRRSKRVRDKAGLKDPNGVDAAINSIHDYKALIEESRRKGNLVRVEFFERLRDRYQGLQSRLTQLESKAKFKEQLE